MAYTSSGTLSVGETYNLGEYALRLIVTKDSYEQQTHIQCNCSKGTEHAQTGIDKGISMNVRNWRVEANGTSADVYATIYRDISVAPFTKPIPSASSGSYKVNGAKRTTRCTSGDGVFTYWFADESYIHFIFASATQNAVFQDRGQTHIAIDFDAYTTASYTFDSKTVYWYQFSVSWSPGTKITEATPVCNGGAVVSGVSEDVIKRTAWYMIYGDYEEEVLVSRFAIDLEDAGGGIGGDWDEPGDTGDPSTTLEVTVTGALSGRHNDPLNDTSYAYTPADQDAATVYGSGGDGGHGGGGGAGASSVIIYKIATDRAGNTEETAIAKRHGYGSGGGKGGTGAGGCILVYY